MDKREGMGELIAELREWALNQSSLHHRYAVEDSHLRREHIASSSAYLSLAEELEKRATPSGDPQNAQPNPVSDAMIEGVVARLNLMVTCGCCDDEWPQLRRDTVHLIDAMRQLGPVLAEVKAALDAGPELNMSNYDYEDVAALNDAVIEAWKILDAALNRANEERT